MKPWWFKHHMVPSVSHGWLYRVQTVHSTCLLGLFVFTSSLLLCRALNFFGIFNSLYIYMSFYSPLYLYTHPPKGSFSGDCFWRLRQIMELERKMVKSRFKRVCVFCGSSTGKRDCYRDAAIELAQELVQRLYLSFCNLFLVFIFCDIYKSFPFSFSLWYEGGKKIGPCVRRR